MMLVVRRGFGASRFAVRHHCAASSGSLPYAELAAKRGQRNDNPAPEANRGKLSSLDRVIQRGTADFAADHSQGLGDRDPERLRLSKVLLIHLAVLRKKEALQSPLIKLI